MFKVRASAPGKVILFGEHAVVHGVTAIAAALSSLRIFVDMESFEVSDGSPVLSVQFADIKDENGNRVSEVISFDKIRSVMVAPPEPLKYAKLDEAVKQALADAFTGPHASVNQGLSVATYLMATILPELVWNEGGEFSQYLRTGFRILIKSDGLPIGAGLGSSAAFSVALTGACYRMRQNIKPDGLDASEKLLPERSPNSLQLEAINFLAFGAEVLLHGNPSGLDNCTSCYGGFVRYTRKYVPEGQFENISVDQLPALNILLTNTQVPRSTRTLVAGVKTLYEALPAVVTPIFNSIEEISIEFLRIVEKLKSAFGNEEAVAALTAEIATLFHVNHHLLDALGVGHPSLTTVVQESKRLGMSCKLTGAGGGGCAITLVPPSSGKETLVQLQEKLSSHNYVTFQSEVGGKGLLWHENL